MERRPSSKDETTDERLLAEFLTGDESAFSALVRRYAEDLYMFVGRFVRNGAAAEDIVQETFVQVHQSAGGFDPDRRFRPWLFTIAANKARDSLRSRSRKREVPLTNTVSAGGDVDQVSVLDFTADSIESPHEAMEVEEQRELVSNVVSKMPDHLREVLVLGYYQRHPYKDIAEILGIPLGTVKSRLHAAVTNFAAAYKRELERRERPKSH